MMPTTTQHNSLDLGECNAMQVMFKWALGFMAYVSHVKLPSNECYWTLLTITLH